MTTPTPTPEPTPEHERARDATTTLVLAALLLGLVLLVAGLLRGVPASGSVVALSALPAGLARADGPALVSAGVLALLLAPIARLLGLIAQFWHARDRASLAACTLTIALLVLSFVIAR